MERLRPFFPESHGKPRVDDRRVLSGIVFTEMAVDEISGPQVAAALTALGFAHAGQHRSKPVQLWQQGSARMRC